MGNTTSQKEIEQDLILFIKENLIASGVSISGNTALEQLGLDSFSIIEILLFVERKYGLVIPDHSLTKENVFSAETISACVYDHLKQSK